MALKNSPLTEDIDIIPFQKQFQEEVVDLFRDGLSPKTYDIGPTVARSQKLFVASKLSKENGGDMYNIWDSYMEKDPSSNSNCHLNHFWVAFGLLFIAFGRLLVASRRLWVPLGPLWSLGPKSRSSRATK